MYKYFKKIGSTDYISLLKSKRLSDEIIKPSFTSNNRLRPALGYIGNKTRVKLYESCLKQDKITFTREKTVNIYIIYEINLQNYVGSSDHALGNSLFGAVELVKNADIEKCRYSGYGIGFDMKGTFSFPIGGFGKNVILFGVDMNSSVHVDNKKKDILILGEGPTQGSEDTTPTAEKKYSVNFTEYNKNFCLSLHYNEGNSYLFVNGTEIYKFKAKGSGIIATPFCLGNISKDFSVDK